MKKLTCPWPINVVMCIELSATASAVIKKIRLRKSRGHEYPSWKFTVGSWWSRSSLAFDSSWRKLAMMISSSRVWIFSEKKDLKVIRIIQKMNCRKFPEIMWMWVIFFCHWQIATEEYLEWGVLFKMFTWKLIWSRGKGQALGGRRSYSSLDQGQLSGAMLIVFTEQGLYRNLIRSGLSRITMTPHSLAWPTRKLLSFQWWRILKRIKETERC